MAGETSWQRMVALGALALCVSAFAACTPTIAFKAELSATRGLKPGDPVILRGARIGQVTAITPVAANRSEVAVAVEPSHVEDIRDDSILVLDIEHGGRQLDLMNPEPVSPLAPPGSMIDGAICPKAAQRLIIGRRIRRFTAGLAATLAAFSESGETSQKLPEWKGVQTDLAELGREAASGGTRDAQLISERWQRLSAEIANMQQELVRQGRSAEAERLRQQLESFAQGFSARPATSTIPRAD